MEYGTQLTLQYDWKDLKLDEIMSQAVFPLTFQVPKQFNVMATKLKKQLNQTLNQDLPDYNLISYANLIMQCAKMQCMHNRFVKTGHKCENVYDNNTANKMSVLLYDIVDYDLSQRPIKYIDLCLYRGPRLINGEYGNAKPSPDKSSTFYIVNNNVKTVPVFNNSVPDARLVESIKVLFYIMHHTLRALYDARPMGHVDGFIFQNICCDSFNYPYMQHIFDSRKTDAIKNNRYYNEQEYGKLMDWHLPEINKNLDINVELMTRTGGR